MKHDTKILQLEQADLGILKKLREDCLDSGLKYGWKANRKKHYDHGHWNREYLHSSKLFPYDHGRMPYINQFQNIKTIWNSIQKLIGPKNLQKCYVNGTTYGVDGYAHTDVVPPKEPDSETGETVIVYLNDAWNIDWAGETVIFNDAEDIELSVLPRFGRLLSFDSSRLHAVRPLSRCCSVLRSVLVFKTMPDYLVSKEVDFLISKTSDQKHSGKSFFEHLYNTMRILEKSGNNKEVCLAGLFHAVYGTAFYSFSDSNMNRDTVRNLIGEYPERLAYEFGALKDRTNSLINNTSNFEQAVWEDLVRIEICNLIEQNEKPNSTSIIGFLEDLIGHPHRHPYRHRWPANLPM